MSHFHAGKAITLPSLGHDIQLGMLFDVRTMENFAGASFWDSNVCWREICADAQNNQVQNAEFKFSSSIEEGRKQIGLNAEFCLDLDLELVVPKGSAKYLTGKKSTAFEARVDVTCEVVGRTRRIPQEILSSVGRKKLFTNPRFTHFVAEVVEGGRATLSFVRSCKSSEEMKQVTGELTSKLKIMGTEPNVKATAVCTAENKESWDNIDISYSGAFAETIRVRTIEEALNLVGDMPKMVKQQMNTLWYKLMPLSLLDKTVYRAIREVDSTTVQRITMALKEGKEVRLRLGDLEEHGRLWKSFPSIQSQMSNMFHAFCAADAGFTMTARRLLPELRDGDTDFASKNGELLSAAAWFERQIQVATNFISAKRAEEDILSKTIEPLLADSFEDYLTNQVPLSIVSDGPPLLLLSLGGKELSSTRHQLQAVLESQSIAREGDNEASEWFQNRHIVSGVRTACNELRSLRSRQDASWSCHTKFGVGAIANAYRSGAQYHSETVLGDIVLDYEGTLTIATTLLPLTPDEPQLQVVNGQSIDVCWRGDVPDVNGTVDITGHVVRYRPIPYAHGDTPKLSANEQYREVHTLPASSEGGPLVRLTGLFDNCDYEVKICSKTLIGPSEWSKSAIVRTDKLASIALRIIEFFHAHSDISASGVSSKGCNGWSLSEDKKSLYLGHAIVCERYCSKEPYRENLALRIVDVAPEFCPDIKAHDINDTVNTKLIVFAGPAGHGKSSQINAFISFLFGGDLNDNARIMAIDDRSLDEAGSPTQVITCYRVRPLSPLFGGKTLLIVDTPGFADAERNKFVAAALAELFATVSHINTIVLTCKATEIQSNILSPMSTYLHLLFSSKVSGGCDTGCLRTIFTFSDAGKPKARTTLQKVNWPVENGQVEVNNGGFRFDCKDSNDPNIREWWRRCVCSQSRVLEMLLQMPPVPTNSIVQVTSAKMELIFVFDSIVLDLHSSPWFRLFSAIVSCLGDADWDWDNISTHLQLWILQFWVTISNKPRECAVIISSLKNYFLGRAAQEPAVVNRAHCV